MSTDARSIGPDGKGLKTKTTEAQPSRPRNFCAASGDPRQTKWVATLSAVFAFVWKSTWHDNCRGTPMKAESSTPVSRAGTLKRPTMTAGCRLLKA